MKFRELVQTLHEDGIQVSDWQVRQCWVRGDMPWPKHNSSGDLVFDEETCRQVRKALQRRRRRHGRRPTKEVAGR